MKSNKKDPDSGSGIPTQLSRDLSLFQVTMIGVGAMIGAGIFVLTGIAAGYFRENTPLKTNPSYGGIYIRVPDFVNGCYATD